MSGAVAALHHRSGEAIRIPVGPVTSQVKLIRRRALVDNGQMSEAAVALTAAGTVVNEQAWRDPAPGLRGLVDSYIGFRQAGVEPARHRGLPSPALTLIFTLDDPIVLAAHPDPAQPPGVYETVLGGLHTAPAIITHEGRQSGIQLGLSPLGARALLGVPASELAEIDVPAEEVLGPLSYASSRTGCGPRLAGRSGSRS